MNGRWRGAVLLAMACAAPLASAAGVKVRLTEREHKSYTVEGVFQVEASSAAVWDVLTDYDRIPQFVPSMRESRVAGTRPDGSLAVEQEAVGGFLFFSKVVRVLLDVRRDGDILRFEDTSRKDFRYYSGSWRTRTSGAETEVTYRLEAEPDFLSPSVIVRRGLKSGAKDLLDHVRAEIVRRSAKR